MKIAIKEKMETWCKEHNKEICVGAGIFVLLVLAYKGVDALGETSGEHLEDIVDSVCKIKEPITMDVQEKYCTIMADDIPLSELGELGKKMQDALELKYGKTFTRDAKGFVLFETKDFCNLGD